LSCKERTCQANWR